MPTEVTSDLSLEPLLSGHGLTCVYQPIVDLYEGSAVAFEALARGPAGSALESPARLFAAAEEAGRTIELDWACRAAAVRGAVAAGLAAPARLFVNVEPRSFGSQPPAAALRDLRTGDGKFPLVVEVTERALAAHPSAMVASLNRARALGYSIAVDDVGAHPASLALMPVIEPDVVKLDLRLIQRRQDHDVAAIARAVMAYTERTGAVIVAEGIETAEHLDQARVLGAQLGQGWLLGRPAALPSIEVEATPFREPVGPQAPAPTAWAALPADLRRRTASKRLLLPMSHHLESAAASATAPPVLVAAFQEARHFTTATAKRYLALARSCTFVAAVGVGIPEVPVAGVRGGTIPTGHPLAGEWVVAVLGPHEAAALVATDLGDDGPDGDRRFDYVITHRRDVVIDVVRSLLAVLAPAPT